MGTFRSCNCERMKKPVITQGSRSLKQRETCSCLKLNLPGNTWLDGKPSVGRRVFEEVRENATEVRNEDVELSVGNDILSLMIKGRPVLFFF